MTTHQRHRAASARAADLLRSSAGAFDLPSIIVGAVVVGILTVGVLASIFGVIPFAQDNGAKEDLASVRTAEGVAKARDGRFMDTAGLEVAGYAKNPTALGSEAADSAGLVRTAAAFLRKFAVDTDPAGTCYVSVAKSGTGTLFVATDTRPSAFPAASPADVPECLTPDQVQALADSVGGFPGTAAASTVPSNMTVTGSSSTGADFAWDPVAGATGYAVQARVNGGAWTALGPVQTATAAHVAASAGSLVEARAAAVTAAGTSAYSASAAVTLPAATTGPLAVWGTNSHGEFGNGTIDYSGTGSAVSPVAAVSGLSGKSISAYSSDPHSCAITAGSLYCWGANSSGEVGVGSYATAVASPTLVGGALAGKKVTQVSTSANATCAVADGAAYCWGDNTTGQLGTGDLGKQNVPVAVYTAGVLKGKTVASVSLGVNSACAVADGAAYCWGRGTYGELGNGSWTSAMPAPVAVNTAGALAGKTVQSVAVGDLHACAVADGAAYCWGHNYNGQDGTGIATDKATPAAVSTAGALAGKTVTSIAAGGYGTCAIADGAAFCWGDNAKGQLGTGGPAQSAVPAAVSTSGALAGKAVTALSKDLVTTCAIADGAAYCWGDQDLGNGTTAGSAVPVAVDTSGLLKGRTVLSLSAGGTGVLVMYS